MLNISGLFNHRTGVTTVSENNYKKTKEKVVNTLEEDIAKFLADGGKIKKLTPEDKL